MLSWEATFLLPFTSLLLAKVAPKQTTLSEALCRILVTISPLAPPPSDGLPTFTNIFHQFDIPLWPSHSINWIRWDVMAFFLCFLFDRQLQINEGQRFQSDNDVWCYHTIKKLQGRIFYRVGCFFPRPCWPPRKTPQDRQWSWSDSQFSYKQLLFFLSPLSVAVAHSRKVESVPVDQIAL